MADAVQTKKLSATVGAEVLDVDRDRLLRDPEVPRATLAALEENGMLIFREIGLNDEEQIAFGGQLGQLQVRSTQSAPEVGVITQDAANPLSEYLKGNAQWHIDGATDRLPNKAGVLTARIISPGDGGTEFASTYAAFEDLSDSEKERLTTLRVVHSMEASLRPVIPEPTPEQLATWRRRPAREHPLVWTHRSGRKSLVLGATADHVVGLEAEESRELLDDLLRRATRPERVVRHDWTVGDMVIWDNTGVLHRVTDHNPRSKRELHRVTLAGEEEIR
jgi:alpha-ketoglutarate-dependent taurine dioxygenase